MKNDIKIIKLIKYAFAKIIWIIFQLGIIISNAFLNNHITHFLIKKNDGSKPTIPNTLIFILLMIIIIYFL